MEHQLNTATEEILKAGFKRKLYLSDFIKNVFKINFCWDNYELISFKHGMMVGMIKLYILNLNDLYLHARSHCHEKLKLVQSFYYKVA